MVAGKPGPVIPNRYLAALGQDDPIEAQSAAPARIRRAVRGLTEKELTTRPAVGKWSIKEVIAHLADGEIVIGARERFVAGMDRPPLPGYDQDAFVERLGIEKTTTAELLAAFEASRAVNVAMLRRLPKSAWKRVGLHSERGEESLDAMVKMYAGHDRIHEAQLVELGQSIRARRAKAKR